jgi:flagellar biosynthesis component FlhA
MELQNIVYYAADAMVFITNSIIIMGTVSNPPIKMLIVSVYLFVIYIFGGVASYVVLFAVSFGMIFYRARWDAKMRKQVEAKEKEYKAKKRGYKNIY